MIQKLSTYIVEINKEWCKGCGICIEFCPYGVFVTDYLGYPKIANNEKCIGCRMCEFRCPDFAIKVTKI